MDYNEQLKNTEEEMLSQMNEQEKLENDIEEMAFRVGHDLSKTHKTTFEWMNIVYECTVGHRTAPDKRDKKMHEYIVLVVADKTKFRILNGKYIPYTVTAEVDNSLGYEENLRAMVSAWLRHVCGLTDKADFMEDE